MKKLIAIMAVTIFIVVCGTTSHAFTVKGEEQVQSTPTYVVPPVASKNSNEAINKLYSDVKSLEKSLVGKKGTITELKKSVKKNSDDLVKVADNAGKIATAMKTVGSKFDTVGIDIRNVGHQAEAIHLNVINGNNSVLDTIVVNARILGILIVLIGGIIIYGVYFRRKDKTDILEAIGSVSKEVKAVPANTKKLIQELDPKPFMFDNIEGYRVTYRSPEEGIKEGYYELLYVPKDPDTDDPAAFERLTESNRGEATSSLRGTLKRVLGSKIDLNTPQGKLQVALIKYLQAKGELELKKIS